MDIAISFVGRGWVDKYTLVSWPDRADLPKRPIAISGRFADHRHRFTDAWRASALRHVAMSGPALSVGFRF